MTQGLNLSCNEDLICRRADSKQSAALIKAKILLPAYNEEKTISEIIQRVKSVIQYMDLSAEIMVIDDGSRDRTAQIVRDLGVTCYSNKVNRGKGYSLIRGFRMVHDDEYVITIDSDGEHFPEDIPALMAPALLNEADMIIGSRFIDIRGKIGNGSYLNNGKKYTVLRKVGNWLFSKVMWILTRNEISDTQSGFRIFRPGIINQLILQSKGFTIETEITAQVIREQGRVKEIAIHNGQPLRGSYTRIITDGLKIIFSVCRETFPMSLRRLIDTLKPRLII